MSASVQRITVTKKIQFKNGMPVTTKKDRRLHGYGMKSIKSTVEKYNGSVVAAQENNWFELKILLPAAIVKTI